MEKMEDNSVYPCTSRLKPTAPEPLRQRAGRGTTTNYNRKMVEIGFGAVLQVPGCAPFFTPLIGCSFMFLRGGCINNRI